VSPESLARTASLFACMASLPLLAGAQAKPGQTIQGVYALQGKTPKTEGHLKVTPLPGRPLTETLDFWLTEPGKPHPIKGYETEMTKKMHVIIVSNDFKIFLHVHPILDSRSGHLQLVQSFPAPGTYQIYSDGIPDGSPDHQVFRYQADIGGKSTPGVRNLPPSGLSTTVGPYEVDLSTVHLQSQKMNRLDIHILNAKDDTPAKDLHPYLGGSAHAVFLNAKDLSYVHAHPMALGMMMDMSKPMPDLPDNASISPDMSCFMPLYEPGTYKLWLQFRGGGDQLYVAEFTINVQ
jgi:hypothetical protein